MTNLGMWELIFTEIMRDYVCENGRRVEERVG
jgi:hypothetical protein